MNFPVPNSFLGRQRCRYWSPLFTQQLRLRHLFQIIVYNINTKKGGSFYYTLHLTTMCAPFYTSEKISCSNPKWAELDPDNLPYSSLSAFVLRIWQSQEEDMDLIITTWGIHLSGLVYLGAKLSEIQPESFNQNTVIFNMRGGFFSNLNSLRINLQKPLHFIDHLNIVSSELNTSIYRNIVIKVLKSEVKDSYKVPNLQKLHSLHLSIRNKNLLVANLRERIGNKCGLCKSSSNEIVTDNPSPIQRHQSQLLTMSTLHKMLQWQQGKPPKLLMQQITSINKQIEIAKFRTKMLSQERDKKSAYIRQLRQRFTTLVDENEECGSLLMENYRVLSKDTEKLKEYHKEQIKLRESLNQSNMQLFHRRWQLLSQLLFIYPIQQLSEHKWVINGIYLPNSENLSDCSDGGLAVALGYVAHILVMCSLLLQVPLRYPITYFGSRSNISDHITAALLDKDRDFPLYAGKDRIQFNYAVYLLNKNIAQMRWVCGLHTADLRATLSNLYTLLAGKPKVLNNSSNVPSEIGSTTACSTVSTFDTLHLYNRTCSPSRIKKIDSHLGRPGLSEILAIPEAFMTKQISSTAFKSYINTDKFKELSLSADAGETESKTSISDRSDTLTQSSNKFERNNSEPNGIERGTDILHSCLNLSEDPINELVLNKIAIVEETVKTKSKRISRSVDSIIDENQPPLHTSVELGSDPLLVSSNKAVDLLSLEDGQQDFLQKWLDSGPALVCSDESLYPDEILGTTASTSTCSNSPLMLRTDALLNTTSFNLVKPK